VNDIYDPVERGYAFPVYAGVSFMGPMAAPVIGSAISQFWSWRWNYYLCGIIGFSMLLFLCAFCPETLADVILFEKGERIWRGAQGQTVSGLTVKRPHRKAVSISGFIQ
jgi:MFS family permease